MTKTTIDPQEAVRDAIEKVAANPGGNVKLEHPVYIAWRSLLSSIDTVREEPITPAAALTLLNQWPALKLKNFEDYRAEYYGFLDQALEVLNEVLEDYKAPENELEHDGEINQELYEKILIAWNFAAWNAGRRWTSVYETGEDSDRAYAELIGHSAALDTLLNPGTGIVAWLGQIKFRFGVDVQDQISEKIQALIEQALEA